MFKEYKIEVIILKKLVAVSALTLLFLLFSLLYSNYQQTVQYTKLIQLEEIIEEMYNTSDRNKMRLEEMTNEGD